LRAIQEREFRPVGSAEVKKTDVRVIAAANNLQNRLKARHFRQDLYYRLNVITIHLPPLRKRDGDVAILAENFLKKMAQRHGKKVAGFEPGTLDALEAYSRPGNVRELENAIERMVILTAEDAEFLAPDLLPLQIRSQYSKDAAASQDGQFSPTIKGQKEAFEQNKLLEALKKNKWNKSAAARELGVREHYVRNKMKKFAIRKPD